MATDLNTHTLYYKFDYFGVHYEDTISLDEDNPIVEIGYDDKAFEDIYIITLVNIGSLAIELNLSTCNDWNKTEELGKVVSSPCVNIYSTDTCVYSFEPEDWSYIDTENNVNTNKANYYNHGN